SGHRIVLSKPVPLKSKRVAGNGYLPFFLVLSEKGDSRVETHAAGIGRSSRVSVFSARRFCKTGFRTVGNLPAAGDEERERL
ncbi:hypothetical protein, partial [Alistipes putredinis]|uniref:hypothetical protein n=1 Tax=Alistipes putredinis TaxID=28117 RepID=UPI003A8D442A